jgi:hypothetical protein
MEPETTTAKRATDSTSEFDISEFRPVPDRWGWRAIVARKGIGFLQLHINGERLIRLGEPLIFRELAQDLARELEAPGRRVSFTDIQALEKLLDRRIHELLETIVRKRGY